jgi:hypothetical protein
VYVWIRLLEKVKKTGVNSIQQTRKQTHLFLKASLIIVLNLVIIKNDQGKIDIIENNHIIPKGCCFAKPYKSPFQPESKNLLKCSP